MKRIRRLSSKGRINRRIENKGFCPCENQYFIQFPLLGALAALAGFLPEEAGLAAFAGAAVSPFLPLFPLSEFWGAGAADSGAITRGCSVFTGLVFSTGAGLAASIGAGVVAGTSSVGVIV